MIDIKGKNAFITGSSRGVGQQIALGLAQKGCNIILHSRTENGCAATWTLLKNTQVNIYEVYGDLSDEKSVKNVISQVNALGIKVQILYNNAAIMTPYNDNILQHSWEDWLQTMNINVLAMYTLCAAFIPQMLADGFGRVVNLISGIKDKPQLAPYGASKWAVIKLTEDLAVGYAHLNIKINALDPGWLRTDMGSQDAPNPVEAVLPGALVPALLEEDGPTGIAFKALEAV